MISDLVYFITLSYPNSKMSPVPGVRSTVYSILVYFLVFETTITTTKALSFRLNTKVRVHGSTRIAVPSPPSHDSNSHEREIQQCKTDLSTYMTLPVEQYVLVPMPLNSKLSRLESNNHENKFLLQVPPIRFWNLQIHPLVTAQVVLESDKVHITSNQCLLQSPEESYIERVRLNERFDFSVSCTLTWKDHDDDDYDDGYDIEVEKHDNSQREDVGEDNSVRQKMRNGMIHAETQIHVNVDPPPPFHRIPRSALETAGNTAMRISMNYLIRSFLRGLVEDYHIWASDATYRAQRASLSLSSTSSSSSLILRQQQQRYNDTTTTTITTTASVKK